MIQTHYYFIGVYMVFCSECGKPTDPNVKFCPDCGAPTGSQRSPYSTPSYSQQPDNIYQQKMYGSKNPVLAAVGSFLIPGAGQLYLGKNIKGIILIVAYIITIILGFFGGFAIDVVLGYDLVIGLAFWIGLPAVINIISIIDAYLTGKQYNDHLQRTGSPPW